MAVVKASFTKSRGGAKASIRYITFRPGKGGEKISRQLFGHDGALSIFQADRMVDEAEKGTVFFRLVISPDPALEDREKDLALWELTQQTILKLEYRLKREVQFVAAEHNDHTPNRHVHVIALIPGRLEVADLEAIRNAATEAAQFQRQERDLALGQQQGRGVVPARPVARGAYPAGRAYRQLESTSRRSGRSKPYRSVNVCHLCGARSGKGYAKCYNCGVRLEITLDLGDNGRGY
jgi:hypothetical protein